MKQVSKLDFYNYLLTSLEAQVVRYRKMLDSIAESKNNETKSSAGDKFETGRAMMQAEQDKVDLQLVAVYKNIEIMNMIDSNKQHSEITLGALVSCENMHYYISVGFGKIVLDGKKVYAISPSSPIGQLMLGKTKGDGYQFNNRTFKITEVN